MAEATSTPTRPFPSLARGDRVAVVAPASPFDPNELRAGVDFLRQFYRVDVDPGVFTRRGYLAGDDQRRADELNRALTDRSVRAILAARGGYGATRLLPLLDFSALAGQEKLLVGFSDITALHAQWQRHGQRSLHASMVAALGRAQPRHRRRFLRALAGSGPAELTGLQALRHGQACGPLCGGNLTVLCALLGTPYMPDLSGCVLFLEDVGERPYRVDRMLTSLGLSGSLAQVAAVLIGAFTDAPPGPDGVTVDEVLQERLSPLGVPVLSGVPAGHIDDNLELPLGGSVWVDADAGRVRFL